MTKTTAMLFGGCNMRGPLFRTVAPHLRIAEADWSGVPDNIRLSGAPFMAYTLGEMLQTIRCYLGEQKLPEYIGPLCNMRAGWLPSPETNNLNRVDVILFEPNTSVEISFDGYIINRNPVLRMLIPLKKISPYASKIAFHWYRKGIVGMDEDIKRVSAKELIPLIGSGFPNRDLTIALLMGATGHRTDLRGSLEKILARVAVPIGVVIYTFVYMPDGRSVGWPAEFTPQLLGAVSALDIPIFDPRRVVKEAGVSVALKKDLRHYTESFMPIMAKSLIEFAVDTASKKNAEPGAALARQREGFSSTATVTG